MYSKISPEDSSLEFTLPSESASSPSDSLNGNSEDFDFDSTLVVFSETKAHDLTNKFRKDADAYYVEAKRSTVSSVAQIPVWMYGVLVVLGWNEAMAILFNPLYFTFLLVALAASYITIQLGMVGPLFQVVKTVGGEVRNVSDYFIIFFVLWHVDRRAEWFVFISAGTTAGYGEAS